MKPTFTRFAMSKPSAGTWKASASNLVAAPKPTDRYESDRYVARAVVSAAACGKAKLRCTKTIFINNRMGTLYPLTTFFVVTSATVRHKREKVSDGARRPMVKASGDERPALDANRGEGVSRGSSWGRVKGGAGHAAAGVKGIATGTRRVARAPPSLLIPGSLDCASIPEVVRASVLTPQRCQRG